MVEEIVLEDGQLKVIDFKHNANGTKTVIKEEIIPTAKVKAIKTQGV